MTREEAITYLNVIWNRYKAEYEIERETLDAYHMAIEALSADAISREMYDDVVQTIIKREKQFADMVSVVRCKDCRHRDLFSCPLADNDFQKDEDFCSWGERREP